MATDKSNICCLISTQTTSRGVANKSLQIRNSRKDRIPKVNVGTLLGLILRLFGAVAPNCVGRQLLISNPLRQHKNVSHVCAHWLG